MSNKRYDILKKIALYLPIFITFVMTIMKIWNIPYIVEVSGTLTAINALIAGIVDVSNSIYKKKLKENNNG